MVADALVPLATIGTVLPGGLEIAAHKMRGEHSFGMLCSASELELGDDSSGLLLLDAGAEAIINHPSEAMQLL